MQICREIVGYLDAVGGFIVVNINCGSIWIYPQPGKISLVACNMVGLVGYGFGGVVIAIVGSDDMIWWRLYGKKRNDVMFVANKSNFPFINNSYW